MIELHCTIATRTQILACIESELNIMLQRLDRICDSDSIIFRHDDGKPTGNYTRLVGGGWKFTPYKPAQTYTLFVYSYQENTLKKLDLPSLRLPELKRALWSLSKVHLMKTPVARNVTIWKWYDKQGRLCAWVNKNVLD